MLCDDVLTRVYLEHGAIEFSHVRAMPGTMYRIMVYSASTLQPLG